MSNVNFVQEISQNMAFYGYKEKNNRTKINIGQQSVTHIIYPRVRIALKCLMDKKMNVAKSLEMVNL